LTHRRTPLVSSVQLTVHRLLNYCHQRIRPTISGYPPWRPGCSLTTQVAIATASDKNACDSRRFSNEGGTAIVLVFLSEWIAYQYQLACSLGSWGSVSYVDRSSKFDRRLAAGSTTYIYDCRRLWVLCRMGKVSRVCFSCKLDLSFSKVDIASAACCPVVPALFWPARATEGGNFPKKRATDVDRGVHPQIDVGCCHVDRGRSTGSLCPAGLGIESV
jgi:hypothetical protein